MRLATLLSSALLSAVVTEAAFDTHRLRDRIRPRTDGQRKETKRPILPKRELRTSAFNNANTTSKLIPSYTVTVDLE